MRIEPAVSLQGHLAVPGDKSISHRSLLLGAVADGETHVRGFGRSADTESTLNAVRALGAEVEELGADELIVHGVGLRGLRAPDGPIDCGNAGTLARLLPGLLAFQEGTFTLIGDESLSRRPMARICEPLRRMGADIEAPDGHLPMTITGGALNGIDYTLPVASAQVKSVVLLAGLGASGRTTVVEPIPSRDHTELMLQAAGAHIVRRPTSASVDPSIHLSLGTVDVPGDFSSAAPFIVAATLVPGSQLTIHDVGLNPRRTGLLDVLERMGARIGIVHRRRAGMEVAGDIEVSSAELTATEISGRRGAAADRRAAPLRARRGLRAREQLGHRSARVAPEGERPCRDRGAAAPPGRAARSGPARRVSRPRSSRPSEGRPRRSGRRSPHRHARGDCRAYLP